MDMQTSELGNVSLSARNRALKQGQKEAQENTLPLSLLKTKLLIPPLLPNMVAREHLIERLNVGVEKKLTLISAAAGSGKTTLLSEWVAQCAWSVAWVSLDRNDNDPVTFWSHVIAALEMIYPGVGEDALALLYSQRLLRIEAILTELINKLVDIAPELVLIFDDYHVIDTVDEGEALSIHQTVAFLLDHLPPGVHIIIASRVDPPLPLARLRANRQLDELRTNNLFFTSHETEIFLTQVMNLELDKRLINILEEHTEGWVAGLQLVALSLQKCIDISQFIMQFTGGHRYILDYLTIEVFKGQPENVQSFLLQTSILDRLNGPLCDAVTARGNSQEMLECLERDNLFLLPLDSSRCWYRYHQLFGNFLRERLKVVYGDQVAGLHRRAYVWYEKNHLMANAVEHALAVKDYSQVLRMITLVGEEMVRRNEVVTVRQWLKMLPEELVHAQPELCLLQAWICVASGRVDIAEPWLRDAEDRLDEALENCAMHDLDQIGAIQRVLGEVFALQAHITAVRGDVFRTIELANQALKNLPGDNLFLRGLSMLNLGFGYWLHGDVNAASEAFIEAIALGEVTAHNYVSLLALCGLAQVQIVQGRRHQAFETSQRALKLVGDKKGEAISVASYAYVGMGHVLYEWNQLDEAERLLEVGITLSKQWENRDMLVYGYTALAQIKQAQGDVGQAYKMLQQAEQYVHHAPSTWITILMVAQQVRLALSQGRIEVAENWVQQARSEYVSAFEQITLVRIYIAKGQCIQALKILEQRLQRARHLEQKGSVIEISILQALAYQKQGDVDNALVILESALMLAEPEGYIRLFIDEGEAIEILLLNMLSSQQKKNVAKLSPIFLDYVRKLLAAFGARSGEVIEAVESVDTRTSQALGEQLTERECEIVRLITRGMASQQIAQQLCLSENTVKWYLKKIYSKLNVHNRTQLIIQAKALDIH